MNIIILDGTKMTDKASAYDYIAREMRMPEYFGRNLDALNDCLSEFGESVTVVILNSDAMTEKLGKYGERMLKIFQKVSEEAGTFTLLIK